MKQGHLNIRSRGAIPYAIMGLVAFTSCRKEEEPDIVYSNTTVFVDTVAVPPGSVVDVDGNVYETIDIEDQRWMAENLRSSRYSNGDPIPFAASAALWGASATGAWCYYNGEAGYDEFHGKLYNWYAVQDPRNACPAGWHVPTDADWQELEAVLGIPIDQLNISGSRGVAVNAGGQLKSTIMWESPNSGATDSFGFSALAGGSRLNPASYAQVGTRGYWWTSSEADSLIAWQRSLYHDNVGVYRYANLKSVGASVRCVED